MPKVCNHENCKNPVFGGGYCKYHQYLRISEKVPQEKRTTTIHRVSNNRKRENERYNLLRPNFLKENPLCAAKLDNCTKVSTEVHHMKGRTGNNFLDVKTWLPICHNCHNWVTENSKEAILLGLSLSRLKD